MWSGIVGRCLEDECEGRTHLLFNLLKVNGLLDFIWRFPSKMGHKIEYSMGDHKAGCLSLIDNSLHNLN